MKLNKSAWWVVFGILVLLAVLLAGCLQDETVFAPGEGEPSNTTAIFVRTAPRFTEVMSEEFEVNSTGNFSFHFEERYGTVLSVNYFKFEYWNETVKPLVCADEVNRSESANGSIIEETIKVNCSVVESTVEKEGWRKLNDVRVKPRDLIRVELIIAPEWKDYGEFGFEVWTFPCVDDECNREASWFNASFSERLVCDIDTGVNSNLTDFPAYCEVPDSVFNSGDDDCEGLRVVNADDDAFLAYEIEGCGVTSDLIVWLKLPIAYETAYKHLNRVYIYYDNTTGVGSASNGSAVFSNNYSAVYHFSNTYDSVQHSSTGNNSFNWTGGGSPNVTTIDCAFGACMRFNSTVWGDINNLGTNYPVTSNTGVISAWIKSYDYDALGTVICKSTTTAATSFASLALGDNGLGDGFLHNQRAPDVALSRGRWNASSYANYTELAFIALTADGTNNVQGRANADYKTLQAYYQDSTSYFYHLGDSYKIGTFYRSTTAPPSIALNGALDELRLHDINRSEDWLLAEYSVSSEVFNDFWVEANITQPANNTEFEAGEVIGLQGTCWAEGTLTAGYAWVFDAGNGSVVERIANATQLNNATSYNWTFTAPNSYDGEFEWLLECEAINTGFYLTDNSTSLFFESRLPREGALAFYNSSVEWFDWNCSGTQSINVVTEPEYQTNVTPIMIFNNTGSSAGALSLSVNASPYSLVFWANDAYDFATATLIPASKTSFNASVGATETVRLWWWVNCSNSTTYVIDEEDVFVSFEWWLE